MSKRGILISAGLHAGIIAAALTYAGIPLQDIIVLPPVIPVSVVTPAPQPQPSIASQVQKNLPPPEATPLAQAPQWDIDAPPAADQVEVEQPQPEALATIIPRQWDIAPVATPDSVLVETEPSPETPEPVAPPSSQAAGAWPASDLPVPETQAAVPVANRQSLTREDRGLRDRLSAAIDVRRKGPKLSLTSLGDGLFELRPSDLRPHARADCVHRRRTRAQSYDANQGPGAHRLVRFPSVQPGSVAGSRACGWGRTHR
jgi:hypothetical protein